MRLKALKPRLYNVIFHTHTVSGIVISFVLFIIFYAGAFSLFRHELYKWENPLARFEKQEHVDYDKTLKLIENYINEKDAFSRILLRPSTDENPFIKFNGTYKEPKENERFVQYFINPYTDEIYKNPHVFRDSKSSLTYMGDTIYRLHYLRAIIPVYGIYVAGLVAFFFLFAIITGILIHWKNILNKFYAFTVKGKWKQIWTNSHTTIGAITIPFQVIYAITGALIGLSILLLAPSALLLFDGDRDEIIKLVAPNGTIKYNDKSENVFNTVTINELYNRVSKECPESHVARIQIVNLGQEDGTVLFQINDENDIAAEGEFLYRSKDGKLLNAIRAETKTYTQSAYRILIKLHYAEFGGYLLKVIYFALAMLTCYVISSGVMVWKTARETSKYTAKQKRFHYRVTKLYLAFTSSLFPAISLIFIANKMFPITMEYRVVYVKGIFFTGWLLLTIIGLFWNNYGRLYRNFLSIGSLLSLCIPISNGIVTGDWFWKTIVNHQYHVFSVDFAWLTTGIIGLSIHYNLKKKQFREELKIYQKIE